MTGGPTPIAGTNPYTLAYQDKQFNTAWPAIESPLDALTDPPAAGITAETTPDHVFLENTRPPVGAGGSYSAQQNSVRQAIGLPPLAEEPPQLIEGEEEEDAMSAKKAAKKTPAKKTDRRKTTK